MVYCVRLVSSVVAAFEPLCSAHRACGHRSTDATLGPLFVKLLTLCAELLRSTEVPDAMVNGIWQAVEHLVQCAPALTGPAALELGFAELASSQLRKLGTAAEWLVREQHRISTCTRGSIEHMSG